MSTTFFLTRNSRKIIVDKSFLWIWIYQDYLLSFQFFTLEYVSDTVNKCVYFFPEISMPHHLGISYYVNFLGHLSSNVLGYQLSTFLKIWWNQRNYCICFCSFYLNKTKESAKPKHMSAVKDLQLLHWNMCHITG